MCIYCTYKNPYKPSHCGQNSILCVPAQSAGLTVQRQRPSAYLNEGCSSNTPKVQITFYDFTRLQFLFYKCKSQDLSAKIWIYIFACMLRKTLPLILPLTLTINWHYSQGLLLHTISWIVYAVVINAGESIYEAP